MYNQNKTRFVLLERSLVNVLLFLKLFIQEKIACCMNSFLSIVGCIRNIISLSLTDIRRVSYLVLN
jgi:hypothetical protein